MEMALPSGGDEGRTPMDEAGHGTRWSFTQQHKGQDGLHGPDEVDTAGVAMGGKHSDDEEDAHEEAMMGGERRRRETPRPAVGRRRPGRSARSLLPPLASRATTGEKGNGEEEAAPCIGAGQREGQGEEAQGEGQREGREGAGGGEGQGGRGRGEGQGEGEEAQGNEGAGEGGEGGRRGEGREGGGGRRGGGSRGWDDFEERYARMCAGEGKAGREALFPADDIEVAGEERHLRTTAPTVPVTLLLLFPPSPLRSSR
jgi:hypothetical protein